MNEKHGLSPKDRYAIVCYRIENAVNTLAEIDTLIENGYYNNAANRLYYAAYYAASALLITKHVITKSHDGVKQMFSLHFVKTGIFPKYFGNIYTTLFDKRSSGDYEDFFNHNMDSINELYPLAQEFVDSIKEKVDEWLADHAGDAETENFN